MGEVVAFSKHRKTAEEISKEEAETSYRAFMMSIEITAFTTTQCFGKKRVVGFLKELVSTMETGEDRGA